MRNGWNSVRKPFSGLFLGCARKGEEKTLKKDNRREGGRRIPTCQLGMTPRIIEGRGQFGAIEAGSSFTNNTELQEVGNVVQKVLLFFFCGGSALFQIFLWFFQHYPSEVESELSFMFYQWRSLQKFWNLCLGQILWAGNEGD